MQECTKRNVSTETKCRFHVFQDERFVDLNLYQYKQGVDFCKRLAEAGCRAIIYTDIACDGAMQGTYRISS